MRLRVQPQAASGWEAPLLQSFAYGVNDPLLIGESASFLLRVNQFVPDGQFKEAASRWNQVQALDLLLERGQQLARQTDGLWFVASHRTIDKRENHRQLTP